MKHRNPGEVSGLSGASWPEVLKCDKMETNHRWPCGSTRQRQGRMGEIEGDSSGLGNMLQNTLQAIEGLDADVIDLLSTGLFDEKTISGSVERTGR